MTTIPCVAPSLPPAPWLPPLPPFNPGQLLTVGLAEEDDDVINDDIKLATSLPANLAALGMFVGVYALLHFFFYPHFYSNPLKRGAGPDPPANNRNAFAALWFSLRMSDDDFERYAGLDALALIEFIRLTLKILLGYGLYGLTVGLMTVWAGATYGDEDWDGPPGVLARISLANLRQFTVELATVGWDRWLGSVASVVGCWYLTFLTFWLLGKAWSRILTRRQRSLADARDSSSLAVLVRPAKSSPLTAETQKRSEVLALWRSLYPNEIYDVRMVRDTGDLPKNLSKIKKLGKKMVSLDAAIDKHEAAGATKKLEKAREKLEKARETRLELLKEIRREYDVATSPEGDRGTTYFVLFRHHRPCNLAKQVLNTPEPLLVFPAPLVADVRWQSLRPKAERIRLPLRLAALAIYYAILCFYIIPITFVAALMELERLAEILPFLKPAINSMSEATVAAISAFLPTVALITFMAVLPMLCTFIAGLRGYVSYGQQARDAFHRLFLFQFVWVFLGVTIGDSSLALVNQLSELARNPVLILDTLGSQLAKSSIFFCAYLSIQFSYQLPKDLARIVPIAIHVLFKSANTVAEGTKLAAVEAAAASKKAANQAANAGKMAAQAGVNAGAMAGGMALQVVPGKSPGGARSASPTKLEGAPSTERAESSPGSKEGAEAAVSEAAVVVRVMSSEEDLMALASDPATDPSSVSVSVPSSAPAAEAEVSFEASHPAPSPPPSPPSAAPASTSTALPAVDDEPNKAEGDADEEMAAPAAAAKDAGDEGDEDVSHLEDKMEEKAVPPEQFPYVVNWAKVMLATTLGMCYCMVQPIAIIFACFYLMLSYLFFRRGLLFSYTHASESRGAFWPAASARLLIVLFVAQLMLTGVHSTKGAWPTALCIACTMPLTYIAHRHFVHRYERQLDVLPLLASATADEHQEAMEHSSRSRRVTRMTMAHGMTREHAESLVVEEQEERKYNALFAGFYVQPELLEAAKVLKDKEAHRKFSVRTSSHDEGEDSDGEDREEEADQNEAAMADVAVTSAAVGTGAFATVAITQ